jgi:hypothetical protein
VRSIEQSSPWQRVYRRLRYAVEQVPRRYLRALLCICPSYVSIKLSDSIMRTLNRPIKVTGNVSTAAVLALEGTLPTGVDPNTLPFASSSARPLIASRPPLFTIVTTSLTFSCVSGSARKLAIMRIGVSAEERLPLPGNLPICARFVKSIVDHNSKARVVRSHE